MAELKDFVVLYRDGSLRVVDSPYAFTCQAEDGDHAEEQCLNAYPEADVVWVVAGVGVDDAYVDYFWRSC